MVIFKFGDNSIQIDVDNFDDLGKVILDIFDENVYAMLMNYQSTLGGHFLIQEIEGDYFAIPRQVSQALESKVAKFTTTGKFKTNKFNYDEGVDY